MDAQGGKGRNPQAPPGRTWGGSAANDRLRGKRHRSAVPADSASPRNGPRTLHHGRNVHLPRSANLERQHGVSSRFHFRSARDPRLSQPGESQLLEPESARGAESGDEGGLLGRAPSRPYHGGA